VRALTIFKGDEGLTKAEQTLATFEVRIAELSAQRALKIEDEATDLDAVLRIDHELAELRAKVLLQHDRIEAIKVRQRKRDHEARLAAKASEIASRKKLVIARTDKATKLDVAVKVLIQAVADLRAADDALFDGWPNVLMSAHMFGYLRSNHHEALSTIRKDRKVPGCIAYVIERAPFEFGPEAEKLGAELITELEAAALPDEQETESAA
jgi:hypothetical protein